MVPELYFWGSLYRLPTDFRLGCSHQIWIVITLFQSIFAPNGIKFGAKINRKRVITIQIWIGSTRFLQDFSACTVTGTEMLWRFCCPQDLNRLLEWMSIFFRYSLIDRTIKFVVLARQMTHQLMRQFWCVICSFSEGKKLLLRGRSVCVLWRKIKLIKDCDENEEVLSILGKLSSPRTI